METRNKTMGFARRTLKNLDYLAGAFERDDAIYRQRNGDYERKLHLVTQVMTSLLGLVVLPQERGRTDNIWRKEIWEVTLEELAQGGWPKWHIWKKEVGKKHIEEWKAQTGKTETLGELMYHVRNAVAHGQFRFSPASHGLSPDSPYPEEITIEVKDRKFVGKKPNQRLKLYWRAEINGKDLYSFCTLLTEYIDANRKRSK